MPRKNIAIAILLTTAGLCLIAAAGATMGARRIARSLSLSLSTPSAETAPSNGPQPGAAEQQAPASDAKPVIYFVKNPETAPTIQVRDIVSGKMISTTDWKGKAVLLNFWATWCPPCREEIPALVALQKKYEGRLQVIGVSEDEGAQEEVLKYVKRMGINYPVVMSSSQVIAAWGGVEALPTTFLINPQGLVLGKNRGERALSTYDLEVRALLGETVEEARIVTIADQGQVFLKNSANATELPDVSFAGLTDEQKKRALHTLNSETCTCGCKLTVSQCRLNDTTCPISKARAAEIVKDAAQDNPAAPSKTKI